MTACRFGRSLCREGQECARCRADRAASDAASPEEILRAYFDVSGQSDDTTERAVVPRNEATGALELDGDADDAIAADDLVLIETIEEPSELDAEDVRVDIAVRFEHVSAPMSAEAVLHALVELTPRGRALTHASDGPVSHVILALDVSASMNDPKKFPLLVEALKRMLYDLQDPDAPQVLVSVVLFAYGAAKLFDAVPARDIDPREIENALRASPLLFGRYTDVAGALLRAGRIAYDAHCADRRMPLRIVILTDGHPQDFDSAATAMSRIEKIPVDVDCLAFGDDADVLAMKRLICGRRGGTVKLVQDDTIGDAFARVAEVAQQVVAKRCLLDVELSGGVVGGAAFRHRPGRHAFGRSAFVGGTRFSADLGTLQRDRTYSLLVQLRLPWTEATETEIGSVVVRIPGDGGPRTFERVVALPRHPGETAGTADREVRSAVEIVSGIDDADIEQVLASLMARRELLAAEQRSERLVAILDRAIARIRTTGSMEGMSKAEIAALASHTRTVVHGRGV